MATQICLFENTPDPNCNSTETWGGEHGERVREEKGVSEASQLGKSGAWALTCLSF